MKKKYIYIKPECETIEMEVTEIIAGSNGFSGKGTSKGDVTQSSRGRDFWEEY